MQDEISFQTDAKIIIVRIFKTGAHAYFCMCKYIFDVYIKQMSKLH